MYCSQTSLENSDIDSSSRSTSSLNLLGLALKRSVTVTSMLTNRVLHFSGLHKANKRLSRAFSFSPEPNKHPTKKFNSPLQDDWSTNRRMSVSSRQVRLRTRPFTFSGNHRFRNRSSPRFTRWTHRHSCNRFRNVSGRFLGAQPPPTSLCF